MLRSVLAVIAGCLAWTIMWLGSNAAMLNFFPQWYGAGGRVDSVPVLLFTLARSVFCSVLAGYLTAAIAGRSEIKHTLALGLLQLALGIAATISFFQLAPLWYHLAFLVLLIPGHLLGGQLRLMRQLGKPDSSTITVAV